MILDVIETKLAQSALALIEGESLFRNAMPADVTVGVMVRVPLQGIDVDGELPGFHRGTIQLITRHHDPVAGMQMAQQVQEILTLEAPETFAATPEHPAGRLDQFLPRTLPIEFPQLDGNTYEFSQAFRVVFSIFG